VGEWVGGWVSDCVHDSRIAAELFYMGTQCPV